MWTDHEKTKIVVACIELLRNRPPSAAAAPTSVLQVLQQVLPKILPPNRVRHISTLAAVPWLVAALPPEWRGAPAPVAPADPAPAPTDPEVLLLLQRLTQTVAELAQNQIKLTNEITIMLAILTKKPHGSTVLPPPPTFVPNLFPPAPPTVVTALPLRRKKVLIVGMMSEQFYEIKKTWGNNYNLYAWNTEQKISKLQSMLPDMQQILVNTKFINHQVSAVLKTTRSGVVIRVNGGVSSMLLALSNLTLTVSCQH